VGRKIDAVTAFSLAITAARLHKTRSGKIPRGTMKKIADADPWTIDDPAILEEIGDAPNEKGAKA
jgi:propionyl-CoA synthetase